MTDARKAPERTGYWTVPVVRGVLAVIPAIVITFSQDHSPELGLVAFGIWALVAGVVVGALGFRLIDDPVIRSLALVGGIVSAVAGLLAFSLPASLPLFLYLVSVWAAVTGFLELYAGLRARGRSAAARDWVAAGVFTAVLAIVFLLLPPDAVTAVGLLGAYLVILGVYLLIGGFSLKWAAKEQDAAPRAAGTEQS
ncbi:HdeD family acid-resistance protein [Agromyces archimandritae]|uniref:DUF308 domain-containing protein n=1 Tax=Agromyces archimandritae TaxID=2781962 RepID=A0A975FK29_9MICO|nr:DUF308 domain-containing protein [Agromyces archimandritae]QTX03311.1 DUF308 domain-containing protein [Agromyces archimandritae]